MTCAKLLLALAFCSPSLLHATASESQSVANPIRKVVTMLQDMEIKVKAEGKKQEALYEKFMCYCETGVQDLEASIAAAKAKIDSLSASIKSDLEKLKQTKADVKAHMAAREAAKEAMAEATQIRKKE